MLNKIIEVKVNRKELEKVLKEMSLFDALKQEIEQLYVDEAKLDEQKKYVEDQLQQLQKKFTQNMMEQETANVAEVIYLKMQTKKMTEEMAVLESVLAEVKTEQEELLYTYYLKFRSALAGASMAAAEYDLTPIFTEVIAEFMAVSKEVGQAATKQYSEVYPDISYILFDNKVQERYPRIMSTYEPNNYKPRFDWNEKTVLKKQDIQNAIYYGQIPNEFKVKEVAADGK